MTASIIADRKSGMRYPEIAKRHGCSVAKVRYHLKRAVISGHVTAAEVGYKPLAAPRVPKLSDEEYAKKSYRRLVEKIRFELGTGCWLWQAGTNLGYGQTNLRGFGNIAAHRAMWIIKYGDPVELDVLHNCNNKLCISPLHLHLGTHKQNFKEASEAKLLQGQWKTHCLRGHPLSGDNLLPPVPGRKWRSCKTCDVMRRQTDEYKIKCRERQKRRRERLREARSV